jgi:hypothetical protein
MGWEVKKLLIGKDESDRFPMMENDDRKAFDVIEVIIKMRHMYIQ